jgi:hypothetical protein
MRDELANPARQKLLFYVRVKLTKLLPDLTNCRTQRIRTDSNAAGPDLNALDLFRRLEAALIAAVT